MRKILQVLPLFLLMAGCAQKKTNGYNELGNQHGEWVIVEGGFTYSGDYVNGYKTGTWKKTLGDMLLLEINYEPLEDSLYKELRLHYQSNKIYLAETLIGDEVVGLEVFDDDIYREVYLKSHNLRYIGASLFFNNCIDCHKGYPFLEDDIKVEKYRRTEDLINLIYCSTHSELDSSLHKELNFNEVEAISRYINSYEKKLSR